MTEIDFDIYTYLSYRAVKSAAVASSAPGVVECSCYYYGFFWVCPNPKNPDRCAIVREQYDEGFFLRREVYYIPREVCEDRKNWIRDPSETTK